MSQPSVSTDTDTEDFELEQEYEDWRDKFDPIFTDERRRKVINGDLFRIDPNLLNLCSLWSPEILMFYGCEGRREEDTFIFDDSRRSLMIKSGFHEERCITELSDYYADYPVKEGGFVSYVRKYASADPTISRNTEPSLLGIGITILSEIYREPKVIPGVPTRRDGSLQILLHPLFPCVCPSKDPRWLIAAKVSIYLMMLRDCRLEIKTPTSVLQLYWTSLHSCNYYDESQRLSIMSSFGAHPGMFYSFYRENTEAIDVASMGIHASFIDQDWDRLWNSSYSPLFKPCMMFINNKSTKGLELKGRGYLRKEDGFLTSKTFREVDHHLQMFADCTYDDLIYVQYVMEDTEFIEEVQLRPGEEDEESVENDIGWDLT